MKQTQIQIQNHIAFSRRRGGARNKTRGIRYHLKPPCIVRRTSSVKKNPDLPLFPNTHTLVCVCVYISTVEWVFFSYIVLYILPRWMVFKNTGKKKTKEEPKWPKQKPRIKNVKKNNKEEVPCIHGWSSIRSVASVSVLQHRRRTELDARKKKGGSQQHFCAGSKQEKFWKVERREAEERGTKQIASKTECQHYCGSLTVSLAAADRFRIV